MGNTDLEEMKVELSEQELGENISIIEKQASAIVIRNDEDYSIAAEYAKKVKATQKKVDAYWEPMRESTYNAYKKVMDHKKEMVDPLKKAEKILKDKMSRFINEKERKRREAEEKLRALAKAEMEKKLQEAAKAEAEGDLFGAEMAKAEAEVMDNISVTASTPKTPVKAAGVSQSKAWKITGINLRELPCEYAGMLLRPADEKAIMQLIKSSKGTISIPGVQYEETVQISVRAS